MNEIKVSVIMGVYNQWDKKALHKAVRSILNQTLKELEFIIYDDGSAPEVSAWIRELETWDNRIVLIGRSENNGLAFSLNACIGKARGNYIARMDADDISLSKRLQVQFDFMEQNKQYAWCGCNAKLFDERGIFGERRMPEIPTPKDCLRYSPFIHPTVMYRRELFEQNEGYKEGKETLRCEDYEIFMRFLQRGYQGYNIQQTLFCYRENEMSYDKRTFQARFNEAKIRYKNFVKMELLFPFGWCYVLRPLVGAVVPKKVLLYIKRMVAKIK